MPLSELKCSIVEALEIKRSSKKHFSVRGKKAKSGPWRPKDLRSTLEDWACIIQFTRRVEEVDGVSKLSGAVEVG